MRILAYALIPALFFAFGCASTKFDAQRIAYPYTDFATLKEGDIVHLPTGRQLTEAELTAFMAGHRVVYVGESHDSVEDHTVEMKILKALAERLPGRVALGLEMLRTDSQEGADLWIAGKMEEKEFVKLWIRNWGSSWAYYSEIMTFARDKKIPLVALNRPRPASPAHKTTAEPEKKEEAKAPEQPPEPEIDYSDPYYEATISAFFAGHENAGPEMKKLFLKGQLLWDETMAETGAKYLARPENADKILLVFAGGNHVRNGFGIPKRLFRRLPESYTIVEPVVLHFPEEKKDRLMDVDLPFMPFRAADVLWAVGYSDLEDKQIRLGVGIKDAEGGGVEVGEVVPESSAAKAGIMTGDVIVELDGVKIGEMFDLTFELTRKNKDEKGKVTIMRKGEKSTLEVTYSPVKHK